MAKKTNTYSGPRLEIIQTTRHKRQETHNAYRYMLFSSRVMVRVRMTFSVWLVGGYALESV